MPYIKQERRDSLTPIYIDEFQNSGELNYTITYLIKEYIKTKNESYQTYNDIIGALECCKQELYRRLISIYENKKIIENGDVYDNK
jgi:hypothetical protein